MLKRYHARREHYRANQRMAYIYSLVGQVILNSYIIMRAATLDYSSNANTFNLTDQYTLGSAQMIYLVINPMYIEQDLLLCQMI